MQIIHYSRKACKARVDLSSDSADNYVLESAPSTMPWSRNEEEPECRVSYRSSIIRRSLFQRDHSSDPLPINTIFTNLQHTLRPGPKNLSKRSAWLQAPCHVVETKKSPNVDSPNCGSRRLSTDPIREDAWKYHPRFLFQSVHKNQTLIVR